MVALITREDYISRTQEPLDHGLLRFPHGISKAQKRRNERYEQERLLNNKIAAENADKEYSEKLARGEVREPTREEALIRKANGHPDNESVQAARRLCDKKGVVWDNPQFVEV